MDQGAPITCYVCKVVVERGRGAVALRVALSGAAMPEVRQVYVACVKECMPALRVRKLDVDERLDVLEVARSSAVEHVETTIPRYSWSRVALETFLAVIMAMSPHDAA